MVTFANRVRVDIATTGTGSPLTLGSAVNGAYLDFSGASVPNGATVHYVLEDGFSAGIPSAFEVCSGVYSSGAGTITRTTLASSNSGSPITLSGSAELFITVLAEDFWDLDGSELVMDADGDTSITADTDDQIDFQVAGSDVMTLDGSSLDVFTQGTGGLTEYDLKVGDTDGSPTYGMVQIGNSTFGRTNFNAASLDLDGTCLWWNNGAPATSNIEFAFAESSNSIRFAIPQSGVGNATYNPRSMLIAGPAPADDEMVTVGYWQTNNSIFDNLACDTSTDGADLGVQNDLEVEGDIFVDSILESTTAAGVTIDSVLVKDGGLTAAGTVDLNGNKLILDVDGDTSITADTDDQIDFEVAGSDELTLTGAALYPATDDGLALGIANTNEWSDLHLASGGVINWNNGDATITHAANVLGIQGASFGVGTVTPNYLVHFAGQSSSDSLFQVTNASTGSGAFDGTWFGMNALDFFINNREAGNIILYTNAGTERVRLDSSGNLMLGGTSAGASAAGCFHVFNVVAPTGSVTNGVILYSEDVAASAELKVRDEAGNITTLSPHNFDLIPEGPSEDMAWAYHSEKDGTRINVDMLKAIRVLEELSGETLVHIKKDE